MRLRLHLHLRLHLRLHLLLLQLLLDEGREIKSIAGHSKGSLSIGFAMHALAALQESEALKRAQAARILTLGAVINLPDGFDNVGQYLGWADPLGFRYSAPFTQRSMEPGAGHALGDCAPMPMDMASILSREP